MRYSRRVSSTPAKAITSASRVERGRWKFVSRWSTRRLYRLAVEERYRFYSFGDAMLIL